MGSIRPVSFFYIVETEATYEMDQVRVLLEWQEEVTMCFQEEVR